MARKARGDAAVSYSRFSQEKQGSIAEQEGINTEVADQYGHVVVARFSDAGVSRTIQERPGLMAMFEYVAEHHEVGFIIVNELERLTAGIAQRAEVVEVCQRLNVWLLTEDMDPIDPFDEDSMHEADQRAVAAKGEVLKVRRRTRRNLRQKIISGTVAMRPAYGVRMKPLVVDGVELKSGQRIVDNTGRVIRSGILETHPEEFPWLLRIFEWAAQEVPTEEIARRLTAEGVPTKSGQRNWRGSTIRGILDNPLYKGEMTWGKQAVRRYSNGRTYLEERDESDPGRVTKPSPLGALIDPEVWDKVAAWRKAQSPHRYGHRGIWGTQLFDGLIYCGKCGNKCYPQRNDTRPPKDGVERLPTWRYTCSGARVHFEQKAGFDPPCVRASSMGVPKILAAMASFQTRQARVTVRPIRRDATADASERARLETLITQAVMERENAQRLAIQGKVSEAVLDEVLADTESRIAAARARVDALRPESMVVLDEVFVSESLNAMADLVDLLSDDFIPVEDRRTALRQIGIKAIFINRPDISIEFGPTEA